MPEVNDPPAEGAPTKPPSLPNDSHLYRGEALAPMVRASTTPLRILALDYGADFCYSEELVDRSITNTLRVENKELGTVDFIKDTKNMSAKVQRRLLRDGGPPLLLRIDPVREAGRLICQIGSGEAESALAAALHVHRDVSAIDLNMGCPKKFSVSGGMGSALLDDPERASNILRTLSTQIPLPISAKIRLKSTTAETLDLLTALIERGQVKAVAIHGRQVGDPEIKPARWDDLKEVLELARKKFVHTRFLVNGDFYTRDEWHRFRDATGADGVLWARPALYNASIFRKPTDVLADNAPVVHYGYKSPLLLDRTTVIQSYLHHALDYQTHPKNVKYVIAEMMNTRRTPSPRMPYVTTDDFPGGQTIGLTSMCHSMDALCKVWQIPPVSRRPAALVVAPAEGEHRYEDSYLLRMEDKDKEAAPTVDSSAAPSAKRARVETPSATK